jgi:hypothetical protein
LNRAGAGVVLCILAVGHAACHTKHTSERVPAQTSGRAPVLDAEDGLTFTDEGKWIRAKGPFTNAVFPGQTINELRDLYRRDYQFVRARFEPRWRARKGPTISQGAFHGLVQVIVIYWLYVRNINYGTLEVREADLSHPSTWWQVSQVVAREYVPKTPEHVAVCASLLGITEAEFVEWDRLDETRR